jgi:hypothetical protein
MARAMDPTVLRSMAKWPDVPDAYGWLLLDRRGNWLLRSAGTTPTFERIGNRALQDFISRNYTSDSQGRWYFQNGPQRVFVRLAYTPLVARLENGALMDHCGRAFGEPRGIWLDDEGSVLLDGALGPALLDDRDLAAFMDGSGRAPEALPRLARAEVPGKFAFAPDPQPDQGEQEPCTAAKISL